jgi:hypothetical protein
MKRPLGIKVAVAALVLLALTSIGGGAILLDDPFGRSMGIEFIVPHLPFGLQDFYLVGVWLVAVFGALPIVLAAGLWFGKKWARVGSLCLGGVAIAWILAEMYLFYSFGFVFFYPLIAGIGALTIVVLILPSSRQFFKD